MQFRKDCAMKGCKVMGVFMTFKDTFKEGYIGAINSVKKAHQLYNISMYSLLD